MIQKLYIHNFRCLENFELSIKEMPSALFIGKNGSGKSTLSSAIEVFQAIGRGTNRMRDLVEKKDFTRGRHDVPMRFEIEVLINETLYKYVIAFELPENFIELRVHEEELSVEGEPLYSRKQAQVTLHPSSTSSEAKFLVDWHLVALPVIHKQSATDPLRIFKTWLAHIIILAPIPSLMTGESNEETMEPVRECSNLGGWFSGLLSRYPAAYTEIDKYLREVMPDMQDFLNEEVGKESKSMIVRFKENNASFSVNFRDLSDGEKCFFLGAIVLATKKSHGPFFCFWDEPDSYLSLSEVGHFVTALRHSFQDNSQILMTSHNPEAIRRFSNENTFLLNRNSHLEPTRVKLLNDVPIASDLIDSLICGDIEI